MALDPPFEQHNFLGKFADDTEAAAEALANHWDSNGDGTGTPLDTLYYLNTTTSQMRYIYGGAWSGWSGSAFAVDDILVNQDGAVLSNQDGNVLISG